MNLKKYIDQIAFRGVPAAALGMFACLPVANGATYSLEEFKIAGATGVSVNAVNDKGVVTGVYTSSAYPAGVGFVGNGTKTTLLQVNGKSLPVLTPTGINDTGAVIGTYYLGDVFGFTWQGGKFTSFFNSGNPGMPDATTFAPFIGSGNNISFNAFYAGGALAAYAGPQATPHPVNIGYFSTVASVNGSGQIAGLWQPFIGNTVTNAVFLGTPSKATTILPPGAVASFGGFLNDKSAVAGDYRDAAGVLHGFIYSGAKYTTFDLPGGPTAVSVDGIDSSGRAVGHYSDSKHQHGFLYSNGQVAIFGNWSPNGKVHVAVSPAGKYCFVYYSTAESGLAVSYQLHCGGSGC